MRPGAASLAFPSPAHIAPLRFALRGVVFTFRELKFKGQGTSFIYLIMLPTKLDCK